MKRQYHTVTDIHDKNPNNFYLDNNRNINSNSNPNNSNINPSNNNANNNMNNPTQNQNANNTANNYNFVFIPFNMSPFSGSVNRHPFDFAVFEGPIGSNEFANPSDNFFLDNFASNFISNFINPMTRIVFINAMQNQHHGNPPASQTAIDKLKHFKMEKKYCKKSEQDPNKLEYPECSICLMEVNDGEDTILLPCGHMFHEKCVTQWLKIHNTCPLCRFELPTDDADYEKQRKQRNQQREENIRNNPNIRPIDFNHPEHINVPVGNPIQDNPQNKNNNQGQVQSSQNDAMEVENDNINLEGEDMSVI